MKVEKLLNGKSIKKITMYIILLICMCVSMLFFMKFLTNISVGADNPEVLLETNLEKYINFKISEEYKGTLVQYEVKSVIMQEEQYNPVKESELDISLNSIDGKYPYAVKVIGKSTEMTNGKTENIEENYQYDVQTGTVKIKATNQDENGNPITSSEPNEKARDEYIVIGYYDTYVEQAEERNLDVKVVFNSVFFEDNMSVSKENELIQKVKENIGELSSISYDIVDISNGYIKSNIINETNYNTPYKETQNITISKKEAQERIEILESTNVIRATKDENGNEILQNLGNNGNLVYKSTKIKKEDIIELLGEDGVVEIFDVNEEIIATINKDTQFQEDGTVIINYENEPEAIIIKTSAIKNEGIFEIENSKEIKSTMIDLDNTKIKTTGKLIGINENIEIVNDEETKTKIETFTNSYENIINIKDSQTNVTMELSNLEWSNKQQNEVVFDIYVNSNTVNYNMLKNPTIKIELPSEVEKVILGSSSVVYANGLELQNPYLETNEAGNIVIVANLVGAQTGYDENTLGLVTDVKISATVILKKDIENAVGNVNLTFTNQYTLNGKEEVQNKNTEIEIKSYKEENIQNNQEPITSYTNATTVETTLEELKGLKLEVAPIKGDTILADGDTVYEGEFIKYNIKVTNTTDKEIDNIKVVGTVPEGMTYGELEAEYETAHGKYVYNYNDTIKEKTIEIGALKPGESKITFYEVKSNDLGDEEEIKDTTATIKAYVGSSEFASYEMKNAIKPAEVQVFLASRKNVTEGMWTYALTINSNIEGVAELKIQLPKEFVLSGITNPDGHEEGQEYAIYDIEVSDDNIMTTKINLTTEGKEYIILGNIDSLKTENQTEDSKLYLKTVAQVSVNNIVYQSNENRIEYNYENILISMSSDNEGEEVKYEDEIEYKIEIKSIGEKDSYNEYGNVTTLNLKDYLPDNVEPVSVTYQNWEIGDITKNEETGEYVINEGYNKIEKTEEINGRATDEKGNKLPDIDIDLFIPFYESSIVTIKCTAGLVEERTKIENNATISGDYIFSKTSNTVSHIILPYNYEETQAPDNPINPDEPDNPINPDDTSDSNEKNNISGLVWLDENEDGQRQTTEKLLNGITVMLVDMNNSSTIKEKQLTDSNGAYNFSELDTGKYIMVFNYDTDMYSLTEYQRNGIPTSVNSDATVKEINLLGVQTKVGLTDIISLEASVKSIDIGLIKNKICDLKLDKYISKVIVKTASGIKEQTYDSTQLAKVEIKSKEIQGAIVVVEYRLVITNEGEISTNVSKIIDYLPSGLEFSSELNKDWNITKNGEVTNTSISNQKIEPGKSIEIALVATKTMTPNTTGTFTNIAEIGEISNFLETKDADSAPGNKLENEDDYSKADLIISVSTGAVIYISIAIVVILIIGIVIILNVKFGIKKITKISMFMIIVVLTIFVNTGNSLSATYKNWNILPSKAAWDDNGSNSSGYALFKATDTKGNTINGYCAMETFASSTGEGLKRELDGKYNITTDKTETTSTDDISLTKKNNDSDVLIVKSGSKLKIGPFKISGNATKYTYLITGKNATYNSSTVTNKTTVGGITTFYLEIDYTEDSINKVEVTGYKDKTTKKTIYKSAYAYYIPTSGVTGKPGARRICKLGHTHNDWAYEPYYNNYFIQDVMTNNKYMWTEETKTTVQKSKTLTWTIQNGDLEIIKQDADSAVKLEGVKIRVKCAAVSYDVIHLTDENGKISIKNLRQGTYTITEVDNPYYGYKDFESGSITVKGGMQHTYTLENTKQTGNLKIEKQDADSGNVLQGVSFILKKDGKFVQVKVGNQWKTECTGIVHLKDMDFKDNEVNATTFKTNADGIIEIRNILKGTYEIIETSVGNNYGYEVSKDENENKKYISWSYTSVGNEAVADGTKTGSGSVATVQIFRRDSRNTEEEPQTPGRNDILTFKNKQKYIDLSGKIWLDKNSSKQSYINNLYKTNKYMETDKSEEYTDDKDEVFKKVDKVTLVNTRTGNELTYTPSEGTYEFKKVLISDLENNYINISFEYDGFIYTNVKPYSSESTGSKAIEIGSERTSLNNGFSTITNNIAKDEENEKSYNLTYNSEETKSTLTDKKPTSDKYSYKIKAYTNQVLNGTWWANKAINVLKAGGDEITNINLGLYEREQPDIALLKDLYNVKISVNGYNHIYEYGQRLNHLANKSTAIDEQAVFNAGVAFPSGKQEDYNNISYSRAIYTSDYDYINEHDKSKELKVYATYKLVIKNESSNLKVRVNEIVDHYHEAFTVESIGTGIDNETGIITGKLNEDAYTDNKTKKELYIKTDTKISGTAKTEIYVQFSITKDNLGEFLHEATDENNQKYKSTNNLENIAEITSYSVFDKEGNVYAGIDKDSNPGNADLSKVREGKREDDTSIAPGFMIEVRNSRKITGTVFLDNSVLDADKTRNGDGIYQEGTESTISGVKVGLYKLSDLTKKEHEDQYENKYEVYELNDDAIPIGKTTYSDETQEKTSGDGQFTIQDFYPGEYIIVYTWGEETYIGGTIPINVNDYKGTKYIEDRPNGSKWYLIDKDTRYSDAMDNYATRIEIDREDSTIATMDSTTPTMEFGIELEDDLINKIGITQTNVNKIEFVIPNIDFGITERARQELDIGKRVESVEITLANGQTIGSFKYNEEGEIEKSKGITYIPPSGLQNNGMIKAELDSELIQGATAKIQYTISLTNNSEKDYDNVNYYLYGEKSSVTNEQIIKYTPSGIYDYLDSTMVLADDAWEVHKIEDYNAHCNEPTITEKYLYRYNPTDPKDYIGYESFKEWYDVTNWPANINSGRESRLAGKTILYNKNNIDIDNLIQGIEPGETADNIATLNVSKLLSNSKEINLNNDVEITKVNRKEGQLTGRPITLTPLYDRAESVVVTPPTGESQNYILIIATTITSLITLGTGIIFIKKKVLR